MTADTGFLGMIQGLTPEECRMLVNALPYEAVWAAETDWNSWAHDGQRAPAIDWQTWVMIAGRGFGKTRAGAEWVTMNARANPDLQIALVAATLEEARRVMVEGVSGLLAVGGWQIEEWSPSLRRLRYRNGAQATLFSGASPQGLRGPEHDIAWCDELAKWDKPGETWDMLQLGLRKGDRPRALITTTPAPGPVLRRIMTTKGSVITGGPTQHNPHLPGAYIAAITDMYGGTRLGRQEVGGELLTDTPGALWSIELIEACRAVEPTTPLARIFIGVDPPASSQGTCGIVACALGRDGIAYVLADHSVSGVTPEGWARAVANAANTHGADRIIAENNHGGNMVKSVLAAADAGVALHMVRAVKSKSARAEPIATRFAAGKIRLIANSPELEAQLCGLISGGGYEGPGRSPDRADAMVWALAELISEAARADGPRVRRV